MEEINGVKGHKDCRIDGTLVDIKSASSYGMKKFRNEMDIIKNLVITENYKYSINPYDTLIEKNQNIKSKKDFTNEVTTEINKVINKEFWSREIIFNSKNCAYEWFKNDKFYERGN